MTLTRARSAALLGAAVTAAEADGAGQLGADEVELLAQARRALDVVEALGLLEVLAQLDDALAVGGLGRGIEQRARVAAVGHRELAVGRAGAAVAAPARLRVDRAVDEVDRVDLDVGALQQRREVLQALAVLQAHGLRARHGPDLALQAQGCVGPARPLGAASRRR